VIAASPVRPPSGRPRPTVSVVICTYTERRWAALEAAVASALGQSPAPDEVIVVVDHDHGLLRRARAHLGRGATVIANDGAGGLAAARNRGVRHASGDVVAFLDDDARADPGWLEALVAAYADPRVIGTGGLVEPDWAVRPPAWLPSEFLWTVGCSYTGLPRHATPVRNPIGANMSFRRRAFDGGGFHVGMGRVGTLPLGCEETEFAIRAARSEAGAIVLHLPAARVRHAVTAERATWRYFAARCWAEGRSKAIVTSLAGPGESLASERGYVARTLPGGILRGVRDAARGDLAGIARAAAILAGLALTTAGYARGRVGAEPAR
jgi:glycosyltransferase involved in cell wall biosynthesis